MFNLFQALQLALIAALCCNQHAMSMNIKNRLECSKQFLKNVVPTKTSVFSVGIGLSLLGGFNVESILPKANALDDPVAISRFEDSLNELVKLDNNWNSIVKGEGDNVRRRLGTVYSPPKCESPLCGFESFVTKFVKSHDDLDISEFQDSIDTTLG